MKMRVKLKQKQRIVWGVRVNPEILEFNFFVQFYTSTQNEEEGNKRLI